MTTVLTTTLTAALTTGWSGALAAGPERPPENWAGRISFTLVVLALFALAVWRMRRSWLRRAAADTDLLPLPSPPEPPGPELLPASEGLYVGTTTADDWQARIGAGGLADRSAATLSLTAAGLRVDRTGADPLFVPAGALRGARLAPGLANKVVGGGGLLVVTWEHRDRVLDTGFRATRHADHVAYLHAVNDLVDRPALATTTTPTPTADPAPPPAPTAERRST